MKAIKKNDENLVKVAKDICSTFTDKGFYSVTDFKVTDGFLELRSSCDYITKILLSHIPCNFDFCISTDDKYLILQIWYETR